MNDLELAKKLELLVSDVVDKLSESQHNLFCTYIAKNINYRNALLASQQLNILEMVSFQLNLLHKLDNIDDIKSRLKELCALIDSHTAQVKAKTVNKKVTTLKE